MTIGIVRERKKHEYRVGLLPCHVRGLVKSGHQVIVEKGAGNGVDVPDAKYTQAGARIIETPQQTWAEASCIVKVKEPIEEEFEWIQRSQIIFTFLHLAACPKLTRVLQEKHVTGIAYETITDKHGKLPLLHPMSQIAGRLSTQFAAHYLLRSNGGIGLITGGIPGVRKSKVTVLGCGTSGTNAIDVAIGMGAHVYALDINPAPLEALENRYKNQIETLIATEENMHACATTCDILIGAVLIPGGRTPSIIPESWVSSMKRGAVISDISIDQGGCIETSRGTTHDDPVYTKHGVIHYCVTNIPSSASISATEALTARTFPYVLSIANHGIHESIASSPGLKDGVNTYNGNICHPSVAQDLNQPYIPFLV